MSPSAPGRLITFEGPEGAGKTTLIEAIAARMRDCGGDPLVLREPGGTAIGERVRDILLDTASSGMTAETELLLMVASRAQIVGEMIRPALAAGRIVLCDRFADASVAYQGGGRRLGAEFVDRANALALQGLQPDLTLLCLLAPEVGRARLKDRPGAADRLEREEVAFHDRVFAAYEAMAASREPRFRVIDAAAAPGAMLDEALAALRGLEHDLLNRI